MLFDSEQPDPDADCQDLCSSSHPVKSKKKTCLAIKNLFVDE